MINVVVEGPSDEGMARAVVAAAGRSVAKVHVKHGKTKLDPSIPNYNRAAVHSSWVVFRDSDTLCPVDLAQRLLAPCVPRSARFSLRLVHPMSEAWLLGDIEGFAAHFGIKTSDLPTDPESLAQAKETLLHLMRSSKNRVLRGDMVRTDGSTGALYVTRINEFAQRAWSVRAAADRCPSLKRALSRIAELP